MRMILLALGAACAAACATNAPAPVAASAPASSTARATAEAAKVTVTITGMKTISGAIKIALYDAAGYESGKSVTDASIPVTGDTVTWSIEAVKPGVYGVKLYQDVNGDGTMNTNPFGAPIEPYAFSNNARGSFGAPKFAAASFTVSQNATSQTIRLN